MPGDRPAQEAGGRGGLPRLGADAVGKCTAVKSAFGCLTHVDGGKIVGRVCVD
jgi:hypothetical protein